MTPTRRTFLRNFASALAAPAVVPAASLMSIRGSKLILPTVYTWRDFDKSGFIAVPRSLLYAELTRITREACLPSLFYIATGQERA